MQQQPAARDVEAEVPLRWREALGRLGLVLAGLFLGLVALEVCLQVGATFAVARRRAQPAALAAGTRRIVCLGDSNTYGIWVGTNNSYPRVLEEVLNAKRRRQHVEVVNLGHPGNNSSAIRNRLGGILDEYHPDIVTVMIGANDMWTVSEPIADEPRTLSQLLWRWSRVYRLLFMASRAVTNARPTGAVDPPFKFAKAERTVPGWAQVLRRNLEAVAAAIAASGAEPILLTYPAGDNVYGMANDVIRATAAGSGIHMIDVSRAFEGRCPRWKCPELLPDLHPTVLGHSVAAETIANALGASERDPG